MKNMKRFYAPLSLILVVVLTLTFTGCGKTTDTPNSNQSQQDNTAIGDTSNNSEESESQQETTAPEAEVNPAQDSDGRYIYVIDGHELPLSVRLEDFIDGDVLDLKGLRNALGYTEGKIRDDVGNIIAETGTPNKNTPFAELSFSMNLADREQTIIYYVTAMPNTDSQTLTINSFNPPRNITFNQLVVAAYLWDYYNDGKMHSDPLAEILSDYRHDLSSGRKIAYQIP